jgi:hypothetical protein
MKQAHLISKISLLVIALFASLSTAFSEQHPNIVFILVDDMGFSDIGCYGGEVNTPHLDRLAENGLRFTNMYNTSKGWIAFQDHGKGTNVEFKNIRIRIDK